MIVLGAGECAATNQSGETIKTFGLGSCVAVVLLDPRTRTVGMAHIALPDSSISPERAIEKPAYFVDTGIPMLLGCMEACGCAKDIKEMAVKVVGGACVIDPSNAFNIGSRNILAVRKLLWRLGTFPAVEDVGGSISRSVVVDVDSGVVRITSAGGGSLEI